MRWRRPAIHLQTLPSCLFATSKRRRQNGSQTTSASRINYEVAEALIKDFLNGVKILYGAQYCCSNMHNLLHLIEDVKRFGPLNSFDAYPFKSKLFTLKRMIRSGNLPLSQVSLRIIEMQSSFPNLKRSKQSKAYVLKKEYAMSEYEQKSLQNVHPTHT